MHGVDKFKPELSKAIKKCIEENEDIQNISNPIYDAVKQIAEIKSLPEKNRDALEIILNKLNDFSFFNRNLPPNNFEETNTQSIYFFLYSNSIDQVKLPVAQLLKKERVMHKFLFTCAEHFVVETLNLDDIDSKILLNKLKIIPGIKHAEISFLPF